MNAKKAVFIAALFIVGGAAVAFLVRAKEAGPSAYLTVLFEVSPPGQTPLVLQEANSAKFRYIVGKSAGLKPVFAQKLAIEQVPNTSLMRARVGLPEAQEAPRYTEVFMRSMQAQCGNRAKVRLVEQKVE